MKTLLMLIIFLAFGLTSCQNSSSQGKATDQEVKINEECDYLSFDERDDRFTGGIRMIPISTPKGEFNVWTKRIGNNPNIKVLLLHGGPGATHELYESFEGFFPSAGIEFYYYDQLGSYYSDQPDDDSLWTIDRFVDEVEQLRRSLNLSKDNFYLFGQSWGGILAMEYAFKYQENLKGLIISNMMASAADYNAYAEEKLGPAMDKGVYDELLALEQNEDYTNPRYMELLMENHYNEHVLRMPLQDWPESINRCFEHLNPDVYVYMQGPSEFGIKGGATLEQWDVKERLKEIVVPTLVIGSTYDTMDPEHMQWMANEVKNGRFLLCPNGSHLVQYDDQSTFFPNLIKFLNDVDDKSF